MLITAVSTPPCDLPAVAGAMADAAAALLVLAGATTSTSGAASPRPRTHWGEQQPQKQKPVPVALSGGAPAWCGATGDGGTPTPTAAPAPAPKRRVSSWSKPQSRVDVQAGAIKGVRDPCPSGRTVSHRLIHWRCSGRLPASAPISSGRMRHVAWLPGLGYCAPLRPAVLPMISADPGRTSFSQLLETTVCGPQWTFEGAIRAALGNNPDTSKGLRKCVALLRGLARMPCPHNTRPAHRLRSDGVLVRRGQGGRSDPYAYMLKREWVKLPEAQKKAAPPSSKLGGPRPLSLAATESDSGTCDAFGGPPTPALPFPPSALRSSDVPLSPMALPVAPGQQPWAAPHLGYEHSPGNITTHLGLCGGWHSLSLPITGVPVFAAGHPGAVALLQVGSPGAPVGMALGYVPM